MKVLAAFDKFKDALSAREACAVAARAVAAARGEVTVQQAPLTDGGEGFGSVLAEALGGRIDYHGVTGALGDRVEAPLGWVEAARIPPAARTRLDGWVPLQRGPVAIIEMAAVAGLEQIPTDRRDAFRTTTYGIGEMIRIAAAEGAAAILLGIGGSATSDLGIAALQALGLQALDRRGAALPEPLCPARWPEVASFGGHLATACPPLFIACDVDNPLLGPSGAAAVYGPQKGLPRENLAAFDREAGRIAARLCAWADVPPTWADLPGCGAAGGIGFGLKLGAGARFVPGFELVAAWLDLEAKLSGAEWVLTGEGAFDRSSLSGKGPFALLEAARDYGIPVSVFAGRVDREVAADCRRRFPRAECIAITPEDQPLSEALAHVAANLHAAIRERASRPLP